MRPFLSIKSLFYMCSWMHLCKRYSASTEIAFSFWTMHYCLVHLILQLKLMRRGHVLDTFIFKRRIQIPLSGQETWCFGHAGIARANANLLEKWSRAVGYMEMFLIGTKIYHREAGVACSSWIDFFSSKLILNFTY